MPKKYRLLPRAKNDIREIARYIARDNPIAAKKMKAMIMQACLTLGDHPHIGHTQEDWTRKNVRFWPVHPNYSIIYDATKDPIEILRIYHSARDFSRITH